MRVAILSGGTEGDIQPLLAISRRLRARGHWVRFGGHPAYHELIRASDVEPFAIGQEDPRQIVVDLANANPRRSRITSLRRMLTASPPPQADLSAIAACCERVDAVLHTPISGLAYHAAEARNVPAFEVQLLPLTPTRVFPSPLSPVQPLTPSPINRLSHYGVPQLLGLVNRKWVNDWRRQMGLRALPLRGPGATPFYRHHRYVICAVSPAVIPKPADWPPEAQITGYLFAPSDAYRPPAALEAFLAAGEPPVCVSFGSTVESDPRALLPILLEAQRRTGRRFVYVRGWANYELPEPSPSVFVLDRTSYTWLYPRVLAVVHHAGTGTAAEALRAGVPSVCVPHITEQRFWATRLAALGVAAAPIQRRDLTAEALTAAIQVACSPTVTARANILGDAVRSEDGAAAAVDLIERSVGVPRLGPEARV